MTFDHLAQPPHHLLFAPDRWPDAGIGVFAAGAHESHDLLPFGGGRNSTLRWPRDDGTDWVLRHYARGGLVARLIRHRYLWLGLEQTRAWRELRLLGWMRDQDLPVPRPIAAHVIRLGMVYEQHLVTERITNAEPLQQLLQVAPLAQDQWHALGRCLRRFHDAGVHHADLNVSNVMLDASGQFHLLDFDRGRLSNNRRFVPQVLARLQRSLHKQQGRRDAFHFCDADWAALRAGHG